MGTVALNRTTAPAAEPVLIAEARDQCRFDDTSNDTALNRFITGAREECETVTGRSLITQTWTLALDCWPFYPNRVGLDRTAIILPRPPVQEIASFKYIDTAGTEITMVEGTDYQVHLSDPKTRLVPAYGTNWPSVRDVPGAITIVYVAGYGDDSTSVPAELRDGMLARIESKDRMRGDNITGTTVSNLDKVSRDYWSGYAVPGWM